MCYWKLPFSSLIYLLKMVVFHSCISLPEGKPWFIALVVSFFAMAMGSTQLKTCRVSWLLSTILLEFHMCYGRFSYLDYIPISYFGVINPGKGVQPDHVTMFWPHFGSAQDYEGSITDPLKRKRIFSQRATQHEWCDRKGPAWWMMRASWEGWITR